MRSELSGRRLAAGAAERLGGSTCSRRAVPAQAAGPTGHGAASAPVHPSGLVEGRGRRPGLLLVPQQLAQPPHRAWGCLGRARCGKLPHYRVPRSWGLGGGLKAGLGCARGRRWRARERGGTCSTLFGVVPSCAASWFGMQPWSNRLSGGHPSMAAVIAAFARDPGPGIGLHNRAGSRCGSAPQPLPSSHN